MNETTNRIKKNSVATPGVRYWRTATGARNTTSFARSCRAEWRCTDSTAAERDRAMLGSRSGPTLPGHSGMIMEVANGVRLPGTGPVVNPIWCWTP